MNNLPDLPKIHNKKEADFGLKFREWIEKGEHYTSGIELKQTDGEDYLNFSEVTEDQIQYAERIESPRGLLIRTKGIKGLPDYIYLKSEPAFFVIKYPYFAAVVRVSAFVKERDISERKSLTSERARIIATKIIE